MDKFKDYDDEFEGSDDPNNYDNWGTPKKDEPTDSYTVSFEYAESVGADFIRQSELEDLGFVVSSDKD